MFIKGTRALRLAVGGSLMVFTGCTSKPHSATSIETALTSWQRPNARIAPRPAGATTTQSNRSVPASRTVRASSRELQFAVKDSMPTQPSVGWYIGEALARHPALRAATADVRAKLERIPQVTSLPDPMLRSIVRPEPIQTAAGDIFFTLGVSQTIPLLTKLELAGNIAATEARMAVEQLNHKRVRLIADVEKAYWQIYLLERSLEITEQNRLILQDLERVVDARYRVNQVAQQDLLRVQTELSELRDREQRLALRRLAAAAALNQLMDRAPQAEIPSIAPIDTQAIESDVAQLIALASDSNPELAMLREQVRRDREQIELADLGYWPDFTVGVEWNYVRGRGAFEPDVPAGAMDPPVNRGSEQGDDNWALTMQLNLPVWSQRIEARKREARQRLLASEGDLHVTQNLVAFRIFEIWSRIETQQQTIDVLNIELIPQARQTYEVSLTSYQAGNTDFLALIDNWRRWLNFELMRHRETVDLQSALAELQREVGMQLTTDGGNASEEKGMGNE